MRQPKEFPPEFEVFQKGDDIPDWLVEKYHPTGELEFRRMEFGKRVEQYFRRCRGAIITIDYRKNRVHICTDAEASAVNYRRTLDHARGMKNDLRREQGVSVVALSQQEQVEHRDRIARMSLYAAALSMAAPLITYKPPSAAEMLPRREKTAGENAG